MINTSNTFQIITETNIKHGRKTLFFIHFSKCFNLLSFIIFGFFFLNFWTRIEVCNRNEIHLVFCLKIFFPFPRLTNGQPAQLLQIVQLEKQCYQHCNIWSRHKLTVNKEYLQNCCVRGSMSVTRLEWWQAHWPHNQPQFLQTESKEQVGEEGIFPFTLSFFFQLGVSRLSFP